MHTAVHRIVCAFTLLLFAAASPGRASAMWPFDDVAQKLRAFGDATGYVGRQVHGYCTTGGEMLDYSGSSIRDASILGHALPGRQSAGDVMQGAGQLVEIFGDMTYGVATVVDTDCHRAADVLDGKEPATGPRSGKGRGKSSPRPRR